MAKLAAQQITEEADARVQHLDRTLAQDKQLLIDAMAEAVRVKHAELIGTALRDLAIDVDALTYRPVIGEDSLHVVVCDGEPYSARMQLRFPVSAEHVAGPLIAWQTTKDMLDAAVKEAQALRSCDQKARAKVIQNELERLPEGEAVLAALVTFRARLKDA